MQRLVDEFGLTHDAVAKAIGRSRSAVSNLLRLTQLAKPVQDYLHERRAGDGARACAARADGRAADGARPRAWSTARCRCARPSASSPRCCIPRKRAARRPAHAARDADTARLETELAEKLGAKVRIEPGRKGAGRIVISYTSLDELDGILARRSMKTLRDPRLRLALARRGRTARADDAHKGHAHAAKPAQTAYRHRRRSVRRSRARSRST